MGVYTFTMSDCTSTVAATRLFNALCIDNHNLFPKVVPNMTKSIEFVEGDSTTVGCIKQINFSGGPFKYVKHRVDELDTNKLYVKYTSIDGDVLPDAFECVVYESTFEAVGTGCHAKMIAHYHTKGDYVMKEEGIARGKEQFQELFNAVEAYLITNPQVYA